MAKQVKKIKEDSYPTTTIIIRQMKMPVGDALSLDVVATDENGNTVPYNPFTVAGILEVATETHKQSLLQNKLGDGETSIQRFLASRMAKKKAVS